VKRGLGVLNVSMRCSVSSDMESQVRSLLCCVKLMCGLFKQTTPLPGPGFDHYTAGAVHSQAKAAMVFKVRTQIFRPLKIKHSKHKTS
jgi:hypothetical protein